MRQSWIITIFLDIVSEYCIVREENSIYLKDAWMGEIPYSLFNRGFDCVSNKLKI
jgi:hypothetical protein